MDRGKELIKNTTILFVGKISTQLISFLLIPLYTFFLVTSDYGYIDLIQTYINLIVPILILRIDSAAFRFLLDNRDDEFEKKKIIGSALLIAIIQSCILIIITIPICNLFSIKYIFSIIFNIIIISFTTIFLQLVRGLGDNFGYSVSCIIISILTVILNIIFLTIFNMTGISILISSSISNVIGVIYLVFRNKIWKYILDIKKESFIDTSKKLLKYSIPMIPDSLSWWIVNVSDRTIISIVIGAAANGIYAVASKFSNILSGIFQVFNMSWQESASLHIKDKDCNKFFNNVFYSSFKTFYSICMLIMVSLPIFYKFGIGNLYLKSLNYIPILLIGNLFSAMSNTLGGIYIAKKDTKSVAKTTIMAALFNIIINVLLIKKIKLWAAAISTILSYFILLIYRIYDIRNYIKININVKIIIFYIINTMFSIAIFYINDLLLNIMNFIYVLFVSITINKNILIYFFRLIIKRRL